MLMFRRDEIFRFYFMIMKVIEKKWFFSVFDFFYIEWIKKFYIVGMNWMIINCNEFLMFY